jgi:ribosomal protein S18 acetylase RimI-like enzyme
MLARAEQRANEFAARLPVQAVFNIDDRHEDRLALADRFDFSPGRNFYEMRCDLAEPVGDLPFAEGLRVQPWSDAVNEPSRHAYNEAFAAHWGSQERDADSWNRYFTGHKFFRADLSRVVTAGDEVAAFAIISVYPFEAEAKGYTEAWIHLIGVRPAHRGRGVGAALLAEALRAIAGAGFEFATLDVDTDNETGALRLYEKLGFTVRRRQVRFVHPLPR